MATGLILVLIVGALGYLGTIYTSPALILLSICCGVMLFLGYGYILYMMFRVKCRIQIPIVMAEQEEGVMICAVTETGAGCHCRRWYTGSIIRTPLAGKEKIIHTDGSGCKEQQPDERGGSSKKQWKLYIPAGSGKILWPAWNRLSDQVCAL